MELHKKETKNSPYIYLSSKENVFIIKGNSYSEDADKIFKEVDDWIDTVIPEIKSKLECEFYFNVINSITYRSILQIALKLSEHQKSGKDLTIIWKHDKKDEDILNIAEDIQTLCDIPFKIIEI